MSNIFKQIVVLVQKGEIKISNHGYDELAEDGVLVRDIMADVKDGKVVEDYPVSWLDDFRERKNEKKTPY